MGVNPYCQDSTCADSNTNHRHLSEGGKKDDAGKVQMSLVFGPGLEEIAKVMTFGAKKYAAYNYRKGMKLSRLMDAALRHLMAFNNGETLDPESSLNHIGHAGACCLMMLDLIVLSRDEDDRWYPEP